MRYSVCAFTPLCVTPSLPLYNQGLVRDINSGASVRWLVSVLVLLCLLLPALPCAASPGVSTHLRTQCAVCCPSSGAGHIEACCRLSVQSAIPLLSVTVLPEPLVEAVLAIFLERSKSAAPRLHSAQSVLSSSPPVHLVLRL